jgi:predicted HTH transcriptional regulator
MAPAILNLVLDLRELDSLRWDVESDRVERKSSANDSEKIRQAICAFANDLPDHRQPGVLFVGLQDDGRCANLRVDDDLLKLQIAHAELAKNSNPMLQFTVDPSHILATVRRRP